MVFSNNSFSVNAVIFMLLVDDLNDVVFLDASSDWDSSPESPPQIFQAPLLCLIGCARMTTDESLNGLT